MNEPIVASTQVQWSSYIRKKQTIVALLFVTIIILIRLSCLTHYCTLPYVHSHIDSLHEYINNHYYYSVLIFIATYVIASALAMPGSTFFLIAAGLLFGVFPGIVFANIGATIGATLLFLTSRYIIGDWVQRTYGQRLQKYNTELERYGVVYLLMVRCIALLPFFSVNILSGLTLLPIRIFMIATVIGMIPASVVFAYAGTQLAHVDSIESFFTTPILFAFAALILFKIGLAPFVYRHFNYHRV